jgi:hypothetical protein
MKADDGQVKGEGNKNSDDYFELVIAYLKY